MEEQDSTPSTTASSSDYDSNTPLSQLILRPRRPARNRTCARGRGQRRRRARGIRRDGDEVPRDTVDTSPPGPAPRVDVKTALVQVKELFEGHNHLLDGFNLCLPKGYEFDINLDGDGPAPRRVKDTGKAIFCVLNEGFVFCEKVEEQLGNLAQYQKFLKKIMLFRNIGSTKEELVQEVAYILRRHPELVTEFNKAVESKDCDEFLAGVASKNEFSAGIQNCTPSYRRLPANYPIALSSGRKELECEVLNDHLIAVASGGQNREHMRKNKYEESLFKCEDDRIELDMLLETYSSCIKRAEEFLKMINGNGLGPNNPIRIEDYFTPLNLRCIEHMYGDHGLEMIDILSANPTVTVPIILVRLKEREEQAITFQEYTKEVWAKVYATNHSKLLDLCRKPETPKKRERIEDDVPARGQLGVKHSRGLTTDDYWAYLNEVYDTFQDQKEIFQLFLTLMKEFRKKRIDAGGLHARVKELFEGHTDLVRGFNAFMPKGINKTSPGSSSSENLDTP